MFSSTNPNFFASAQSSPAPVFRTKLTRTQQIDCGHLVLRSFMKYFNSVNASVLCKTNRPSFCLILQVSMHWSVQCIYPGRKVVNLNTFAE